MPSSEKAIMRMVGLHILKGLEPSISTRYQLIYHWIGYITKAKTGTGSGKKRCAPDQSVCERDNWEKHKSSASV